MHTKQYNVVTCQYSWRQFLNCWHKLNCRWIPQLNNSHHCTLHTASRCSVSAMLCFCFENLTLEETQICFYSKRQLKTLAKLVLLTTPSPSTNDKTIVKLVWSWMICSCIMIYILRREWRPHPYRGNITTCFVSLLFYTCIGNWFRNVHYARWILQ